LQVWCDVFIDYSRPNWYKWRIVIDTVREMFTVVDDGDSEVGHQLRTVLKVGDTYVVTDVPTNPLVSWNIVFRVNEGPMNVPHSIEVVGGVSWFKHVVYGDGWRAAEKPFNDYWRRVKALIPPPQPLSIPRLLKYEAMLKTPIYKA